MKHLVYFICLLFTQTLIAQPYTAKWSEIARMPMAEQIRDILYNGKDVFFFTNHLLLKYNGSTLKEEFQGDFPMPALTGDLSKEKQVLVRAYILGGKLWLISGVPLGKKGTRLFLSTVDMATVKNNNDAKEIGRTRGWVFAGKNSFFCSTYILPDSSGIFLRVGSEYLNARWIGYGDQPSEFFHLTAKGEKVWQYDLTEEEFGLNTGTAINSFAGDASGNLVFMATHHDKEMKWDKPESYSYWVYSYNAKSKKLNKVAVPSENYFYTSYRLGMNEDGSCVLAGVYGDKSKVDKKGKIETDQAAGVYLIGFDASHSTVQFKTFSPYKQETLDRIAAENKIKKTKLIHLEKTGKNWMVVTEQREDQGESLAEANYEGLIYSKNLLGALFVSMFDAKGASLFTAFMEKNQESGGPSFRYLSALCFAYKEKPFLVYNDRPENMKLSGELPPKHMIRDAESVTYVATVKDGKIEKLGTIHDNEKDKVITTIQYSRRISPNKCFLIARAAGLGKDYQVGMLTVNE